MKQAINRGADLPLADAAELDQSLRRPLEATRDYEEGIRAHFEKRKPVFPRGVAKVFRIVRVRPCCRARSQQSAARPHQQTVSERHDHETEHGNKPLSGMRVVDFSRFFAGPYCAQLLGDLGAEVVKVEIPGGGDPLRLQGPPFLHGNGITYYATNRNKRSLTLDMQTEEGKKLARRLCLKADVVLENFRPDVMPRLGLGYDSLARTTRAWCMRRYPDSAPTGPT